MWVTDTDPVVPSPTSGSDSESEVDSGVIASLAPTSLMKHDDAVFRSVEILRIYVWLVVVFLARRKKVEGNS